ncbi:hypothetical protein B5F86_12930 [Lachnoclostridium sp. An298]|nr:hypothetical protein B5F86_12930 [Lachnoclostridium sp. An298]
MTNTAILTPVLTRGVKLKKNDNFKSGKCLQTIDFTGFAKKFKKISTHLLTVLTITAIFLLEHENQVVSADLPSLPDQSYGSE